MRGFWVAAAAALVIATTSAEAATGVVFIHGKGGTDLANPAVARAYWTEDMIRATTKGYAIPHLVCSYDGNVLRLCGVSHASLPSARRAVSIEPVESPIVDVPRSPWSSPRKKISSSGVV